MPIDRDYSNYITAISHASRRLNKATDKYEHALVGIELLKAQRDARQSELDAARDAYAKAKRAGRDGASSARDRDTLEDWNA